MIILIDLHSFGTLGNNDITTCRQGLAWAPYNTIACSLELHGPPRLQPSLTPSFPHTPCRSMNAPAERVTHMPLILAGQNTGTTDTSRLTHSLLQTLSKLIQMMMIMVTGVRSDGLHPPVKQPPPQPPSSPAQLQAVLLLLRAPGHCPGRSACALP